MNEHSIIDVPEMREMIFRHLDEKDREKAIFVSPSMHRIICGLPQKRLTLTTKVSLVYFLKKKTKLYFKSITMSNMSYCR